MKQLELLSSGNNTLAESINTVVSNEVKNTLPSSFNYVLSHDVNNINECFNCENSLYILYDASSNPSPLRKIRTQCCICHYWVCQFCKLDGEYKQIISNKSLFFCRLCQLYSLRFIKINNDFVTKIRTIKSDTTFHFVNPCTEYTSTSNNDLVKKRKRIDDLSNGIN